MAISTIVWFRLDLRLADNPALAAASQMGGPVIPVFIWAPEEEGDWAPGGASRWWLHQSLANLRNELSKLGASLVVRRGPTLDTLRKLAQETSARAVFWNRRYEPSMTVQDQRIMAELGGEGLDVRDFNAALLREPWTVQNKSGKPFQVFTPFWKTCLSGADPEPPLAAPVGILSSGKPLASLQLEELALEPRIKWTATMSQTWVPGEAGAEAELERFFSGPFAHYTDLRNRPDTVGTSRLSAHLHFGEISPRQVFHAMKARAQAEGWQSSAWRGSQFYAELGWREFAHHLLFHFPRTPHSPLREEFQRFPWRAQPEWLKAWQQGRTGYPIIDAGMRQLWATGWMHNRVRMVVASFLVKNLLIPWQDGAAWFWDTLVDADLASNTLGWQWTAGCGADAAPFFRIFNPVLQGEKFDPEGTYVRRWVPELSRLSAKWIHRPWEAPLPVLAAAGVRPGKEYPEPLVTLFSSRERALEAYQKLRA
jgi:deoxyribodipyrimidine photo-lyase